MIRRHKQRGSAMLEFVLSGIPLIFIWIGIIQMAIGMWQYESLQYAAKTTGNYLAHHGSYYIAAGNTAIKIQDAANVLSATAFGVPADQITVTWTATPQVGSTTTVTCLLSECKTNTTTWPPTAASFPGSVVTIRADYVYHSSLAMFIPGQGAVQFQAPNLPGYTRQVVLF
jgi:Flp pilus assembly protein TadG